MCIPILLINPYNKSIFGFVRLEDPGHCSDIMEILTFFAQKLQQNFLFSVRAATYLLSKPAVGILSDAQRD